MFKNKKENLLFVFIIVILLFLSRNYWGYFQTIGWTEYNNGVISFRHPKDIIVSDKEFEDFKYFEKDTLHVQKYNLNGLIGECIGSFGRDESYFRNIIQEIQEGKGGTIDHISCNATIGDIQTTPITVDGINGLVINYYFTQDDQLGCLTQFNTELLLVKDINNIYSFTVKNNFGEVYKYLLNYKGQYGEACIYSMDGRSTEKYIQEAIIASDMIQKYYKNGESLLGTDYEGFEKNDQIIKKIFRTIKIKEKRY